MAVSSMWQMKVNFAFSIFLTLMGILGWRVVQDQKVFREEVIQQLREFENRVGGAEGLGGEGLMTSERSVKDMSAHLESRLIRKLNELEDKIGSKYEDEVTEWSKTLANKGFKMFSQNDEDGAIEAVFDFIGTTDKIYVEFGVETCIECNSRYLR